MYRHSLANINMAKLNTQSGVSKATEKVEKNSQHREERCCDESVAQLSSSFVLAEKLCGEKRFHLVRTHHKGFAAMSSLFLWVSLPSEDFLKGKVIITFCCSTANVVRNIVT